MTDQQERVRVAILGGGMAALSAAFELSHPRQGGRYEIKLYQLGWRLGGKCASGRDRARSCRIQEHGPHILFGFYDNAFHVLRECYQELARQPGEGFATIEDALQGQDEFAVMEPVGSSWKPWPPALPAKEGEPGTDDHPTHWHSLMRILEWLVDEYERGAGLIEEARQPAPGLHEAQVPYAGPAPAPAPAPVAPVDEKEEPLPKTRVREALECSRKLDPYGEGHTPEDYEYLARLIDDARTWFWERWDESFTLSEALRRFFILMDLSAAIVIGALRDDLYFPSAATIERVNRKDYRGWLSSHGARPMTVNCAPVRGQYDTVFAYPQGDIRQAGSIEAGSSVRANLEILGYRGHVLWKMRAGTGDVAAAPLYQVLRRRGVAFHFFHRVDEIVPTADGRSVERVRIGRQVRLKSEPYEPLFEGPGGLPCWPSEPCYQQIVEGDELQRRKIDLESHWTPWQDTGGQLVLEKGGDFDILLLGISIGALGAICAPLAQVNPAWQAMLSKVATVQTQNVQLWLSKDTGWQHPPEPVVTGYDDPGPVDTWLDASDVIAAEGWPAGEAKHMAMLCGPMATPRTMPEPGDHGYPAESMRAVRQHGLDFLRDQGAALWPALRKDGDFDWDALLDAANGSGSARLDAQYLRADINPSDRYVQSLPDTARHRLRPDRSGFDNLVLAGDWTDNGMNLGSFEAAVMSGRLASRAISGQPQTIYRLPPYYFEEEGTPP